MLCTTLKKSTVLVCTIALLGSNLNLFAQKQVSRILNSKIDQEFAPSISADGKSMVFLRKYRMAGRWSLLMTNQIQRNVWSQASEVTSYDKNVDLHYVGGHFLCYDKSELYYATKKSPGIGGYDIWSTKFNGRTWGQPINHAKPLNSTLNDVCPSVSADGKTMYFVQSTQNENGIHYGNIMVSKRGKDWSAAKPLNGTNINTGNETKPLILADGQTLIFSSKRPGGKGGFDLYLSRLEGDTWGEPVPLDYLNDETDNINVAIPANNYAAYYSKTLPEQTADLFMSPIPDEFKGKNVMIVKGKITDGASKPLEGNVFVFDPETNKSVQRTRIGKDGKIFLILVEGRKYDLSILAGNKKHNIYSEIIDLTELEKYRLKNLNVDLPQLSNSQVFSLNNVCFENNVTTIDGTARGELLRLAKIIKANTELSVSITLTHDQYREDSVQTDQLTEMSESEENLFHNNKLKKQADALIAFFSSKGIEEGKVIIKTKLKRTVDQPMKNEEPIKIKTEVVFQ